jgi:hypothetical protein
MLQDKYVACGFLEAAAVLVSGTDRKLHKGGLVTLNALLARSRFFPPFFPPFFFYSLHSLAGAEQVVASELSLLALLVQEYTY